jgi:DMSO reductase family type II enzyme heme b subunit
MTSAVPLGRARSSGVVGGSADRWIGGRGAAVVLCVSAALTLPSAPVLLAQDAQRGKPVYERWCAGCHGETGAGDGEAAAFMLPRPRDFRRGDYQIRTTASGELPTDADLRRVIDLGMPGTAMAAWAKRLNEQQRNDLAAYLKTFSRFFEGASPEPIEFGRAPRRSDEGLAEGERVFQQLECFRCHGDQGRGDGPSAPTLTDDWDFPIRAADLTEPWSFNGGSTVEDIYRRFRTGLNGTPMPSYSDVLESGLVTEEQLWRVAQYVRSLAPPGTPRVREVIRAQLAEGALPAGPTDGAWEAVQRFYVPLVGQIAVKPRWFAPTVDGVWVQAVHDGRELALRLEWNDPSRSPDPAWQEWVVRIAATMTDADGPVDATQGPDRMVVQFPLRLSDGMERPYFLGGSARGPVYQWRWASAPDRVEEGSATGLGSFVPFARGPLVTHAAAFEHGRWRLQLTRALAPSDTVALAFQPGRAVPVAFFAADGSSGEAGPRGSISAWYQVYLDVPTPATAFVTPIVAMLLTAGLGIVVIVRAQQRGRRAGSSA